MKSNELRIGNWIHIGGKDTQVYELYNDLVTTTLDKGMYEYIYGAVDPIELTTEWLKKKFGFAETEDYLYMAERGPVFKLDNVSILYHRGEFSYGVEVYDGGTGEEWSFLTDIKYVHQLQNLYFAITYNELE